jgi:hypothetical protein
MTTQQLADDLLANDGTDLDATPAWETKPGSGKFLFSSFAAPSNSNSIPGVYHKPPTTGPETGANLPCAFNTLLAPFAETKVSSSILWRVSAKVGSIFQWPSTGNVDIEAGLILRASGSDFATKVWYELGFVNVDASNSAQLAIRRVNAGVRTVLAIATIGSLNASFNLPTYNVGGGNPLDNTWCQLFAVAETLGTTVKLEVFAINAVGQMVDLKFDDTSVNRIATSGFGGIFGTGDANTSGSLWVHFEKWTLNANGTNPAGDPPPDAVQTPQFVSVPNYASIPIGDETTMEFEVPYTIDDLPVLPDNVLEVSIEGFETNLVKTESGYEITHPSFPNARRRFRLTWGVLNNTDANTLQAFFESKLSVRAFRLKIPKVVGAGDDSFLVALIPETFGPRYVGKGSTLLKAFQIDALEVPN